MGCPGQWVTRRCSHIQRIRNLGIGDSERVYGEMWREVTNAGLTLVAAQQDDTNLWEGLTRALPRPLQAVVATLAGGCCSWASR